MANKIAFNSDYPTITKSDELYHRAKDIMTPVTQTMAKGPGQYTKGIAPKYLSHGIGSHVWDVDGNEYIDFNMGIGPISLGYCYPKVDDAIINQLKKGITFSLMHELEVHLSELVHKIIPNAEAIRISKSGCDVTTAAVRIARAYTGRSKVVCCGYHGWHDWYIGTTSRSKGIPDEVKALTSTFDYNNIESLKAVLDEDVACVILEPFIFDEPKDNFLNKVAELTRANGSLLVFDEMWTGFRVALGGAQEYFGIKADLACFSKACANGMPISLLTGRHDVMKGFEGDVFFYTTFGGEALSLAAAIATINEIKDKKVNKYLAEKGRKLKDGYNKIAAELVMAHITKCSGFDCRTIMTFDANAGNPLEMKTLVQQEMIKRGVLWGGFHNMCFSHTDEDIDYTLKAYRDVLPILKKAVEEKDVKKYLKGEVLDVVFRKITNESPKAKAVAAQ